MKETKLAPAPGERKENCEPLGRPLRGLPWPGRGLMLLQTAGPALPFADQSGGVFFGGTSFGWFEREAQKGSQPFGVFVKNRTP